MLGEAASALGLRTVVLAEHPTDAAVGIATDVVPGVPTVEADLRALAERAPDRHVRPRAGRPRRCSPASRRPGRSSGRACARCRWRPTSSRCAPAWPPPASPGPAFAAFGGRRPGRRGPAVRRRPRLAGRGQGRPRRVRRQGRLAGQRPGRRGRGRAGRASRARCSSRSCVPIDVELAVLVARRPGGETVTWAPVETTQVDGVCREVLVPGRLDRDGRRRRGGDRSAGGRRRRRGRRAGDRAVLGRRPAAGQRDRGPTAQLRPLDDRRGGHVAVREPPAGRPRPAARGDRTDRARPSPASTSSATPDGTDPAAVLAAGLAIDGAHVHLYGKEPRPGRKLGHVTVCGDDADDVREPGVGGRRWPSGTPDRRTP